MSAKVLTVGARTLVSQGTGAVLLSLLAVCLLVSVVGGAGLLFDSEWVWGRQLVTITDCEFRGGGAVSLYWLVPGHRTGPITYQLARHRLDGGRTAAQVSWPGIKPICIAAQRGNDRLFIGARNGMIYSVGPWQLDAAPQVLGEHPDREIISLACTADGRHLLSLGSRGLCAWNLDTNTLRWRRDMNATCFDLCAGSGSVICGRENGQIEEIEIKSGSTIRSVAGPSWTYLRLRLSPDGRMISCVGGGGQMELLHWPDATPVWKDSTLPNRPVAAGVALFSPCGRFLITPGGEDFRTLRIWNIATGEQVSELEGHCKPILGAEFDDEGRLLSWGTDGTVRMWDLEQQTLLRVTSLSVPGRDLTDRLQTALYDVRSLLGVSPG